jgi:hypothetical protein
VAHVQDEGHQLVEALLPVSIHEAIIEADAVKQRHAGRVKRPQACTLALLVLPRSLLLAGRCEVETVTGGVQVCSQAAEVALPVLRGVELEQVGPLRQERL